MNWQAIKRAALERQRTEREFAAIGTALALSTPGSPLRAEFDELGLAISEPEFYDLLQLARSPLDLSDEAFSQPRRPPKEVEQFADGESPLPHQAPCETCSHPAGVHANLPGKNRGRCSTKGCNCLKYQKDAVAHNSPEGWPRPGHDNDHPLVPAGRGGPHETPSETVRRTAKARGHLTASAIAAGVKAGVIEVLPARRAKPRGVRIPGGDIAYAMLRALGRQEPSMRQLAASGQLSRRHRVARRYDGYRGPSGRAISVHMPEHGLPAFICDARTGVERTDLAVGPGLSLVAAGSLVESPLPQKYGDGTEVAELLRSHHASLTAALDAMGKLANRPQPRPVFNVNMPPQPAPIVNIRVEAAKAAPAPVVNVHVPEQKSRSIRVETDGMGGKVYRAIVEDDE